MVTKYSGRTGSVKGRTKLVLTYSPTSVKNSTSSVKVTAKFYYESKYRTQDSFNTGKLSGSLGSWSGGFSINGTSKLIKTITKTVSTSYSGSKKITVTGTLQTIEASPGSHYVKASIRIPKRPVARPHTPSNVNMALLSDNRTKTTWSHSTSTARPVSSYTVQYQRLDGGSWTGWMHSATVKGKSYTSNPGANNKSYRRRVRANNSAGSSSWAYSNYVRMQPYAPVNVRAKVQPSGSGIKVTWDFNNPAETACFKLQLQRRVNGGSWTTVSSSFGQVKSKPYTSSYTDTTPGAGANQYRIRILNDCEGDDSVWSESNTVSTIVPPKAPTNLSPDGNVVDFTGDVLFTWQHHDAGDGADQTHYDLRYRAEGESAWTFAPDGGNASEVSDHLFEAGELVNGVNYEWQVRTQGNTKEGFGPWSKSAFVTGWTAPVVAIKYGAPPNPLTALPVPLAWTYAQDEGQGQIEWQARLYALGSGDVFDSILEEKSAESSSTSTEFATALSDGERYGVMVRARSSQGQWSEWSETTFDVELLVPAELRVVLDYGEDTGQMNLNITSDEAVQGETAEVVSIDVERRINGGEWVPIMVEIPFDAETTLVDNVPSIWGVNEYRVTATTEAPSTGVFGPFRKTVTPYLGNTENWLFLNYGETFDYMLRMQGDLSMSGSYDRSKETQKLLGRKKPISLLGQQLSREHQVTGTVEYHEECEFPVVPDVPRELVGSAFFDDVKAWNFSKVQAGPDSQITADAHYRAKRYGYLMDVVDGNTENLVSPSPRSGVPGTEVPGREVEEVVAQNIVKNPSLEANADGWNPYSWTGSGERVKGNALAGDWFYRLTATSTLTGIKGRYIDHHTEVKEGEVWTLSIFVRPSRTISMQAKGEFRDSRGHVGSAYQHGPLTECVAGQWTRIHLTMTAPGDATIIRHQTYLLGATLLSGDTLDLDAEMVSFDEMIPYFDGDGEIRPDELVRRNLALNPRFANGLAPQTPNNYDEIQIGGGGVATIVDGWLKLEKGTGNYPAAYAIDTRYAEESRWQGKTFTVSATLRLDEPTQGSVSDDDRRLDFGYVQNGNYNYLKGSSGQAPTVPGEYRLSVVCNVPVDASAWFVRFMGDVSTPSATPTYWTDVVLEEGSTPSEFFDGDSQDNGMFRYEYEGEPGNSTSLEYRVADVLRHNVLPAIEDFSTTATRSEAPSGATRYTTTTTTATYITTTRPFGEMIPYTEDAEVLIFRLSVSKEDEPVCVRLRTMLYDATDTLVADSPDDPFDVPNDGVVHEYSIPVVESAEATGVRAMLYIRDGANEYRPGNVIDVHTAYLGVDGEPFDGDTPDTFDRLYRWAPDGSSIELVTDSQSLYRWTGAEAASESEKYLPAAPGHFDEYSEWLNVEPGGTYQVEAFVKAPGLRSVARRNLTSQGTFVTDRRLWGSAEIRNGNGAFWQEDSNFEYGAVSLSKKFASVTPTPKAFLDSGVKASTLGLPNLSGRDFTFGIDVYAEDVPDAAQRMYVRYLDAEGEVTDTDEHEFTASEEIERQVFRFTVPANTDSIELCLSQQASNTSILWSNATFEEGATDGSWIDESAGREWLGAENIDAVQLMVEEFDSDGESLSIETVAELGPEDFSNRWRTIAGEYTVGLGTATVRTWVEWVVNGDHPELQSDWHFGGMKATNVYVVPDRWPGPDANPDEWREAQYDSTTVCLRTPSGHRVFGAMSGLSINAVDGSLDLSEVSFTVTETDYTENPLVIDESDIWDNIVVDAQNDSLQVQPRQIETQQGWSNIVVTPHSESDA